jgi:predicted Ser/Thr protein kinase
MSRYIGQDIGGYRVIEAIGAGGMASVFKAYDARFDRFVALKILPEHMAEDPTYLARFEQEAKIIARLEHPNILPVYGYGQDRKITYLAMRYLRGGTLKDLLISAGHALPLADATRLITQIADALDYAHSQNIVHRDIKPSNILIDSAGDAYLMDFGIARVLEGTAHLTATGSALGTPAYMSPEQGLGRGVDHRADIYSLGVILYEMATGRPPFQADTPYALIIAHAEEPLPLPSTFNPDIPEHIERVLFKALAKNPADRFASAGELARALTEVAAGEGGALADLSAGLADARPTDTVTADVRRAARHKQGGLSMPVLMGGLALAGLATILIGAALNGWGGLTIAQNTPDPAQIIAAGGTQAVAARTQVALEQATRQALLALTPPTVTPTGFAADFRLANAPAIPTNLGLQNISNGSFSPDGSQIAFSGDTLGKPGVKESTSIYIINADFTNLHEIPSSRGNRWPSWSPDGEWLAFNSNGELAVMRLDGSGFHILDTHNNCVEPTIEWSPDSTLLVLRALNTCVGNTIKTLVVSLIKNQVLLELNSDRLCMGRPVAFAPDGQHIIHMNQLCLEWVLTDITTGESQPYTELTFPIWWTSQVYPQWGEIP